MYVRYVWYVSLLPDFCFEKRKDRFEKDGMIWYGMVWGLERMYEVWMGLGWFGLV